MFKNSNWIFAAGVETSAVNIYIDYEVEFEVTKFAETSLYISAVNMYAVFVNGQFVNSGQYPGYEDYQVYDTLDIMPYIKRGKNQLKITQYVMGQTFFTHRALKPGVIFAVWQGENCLLGSNTRCKSRVNPYYEYGKMESVTGQLGFVFRYDASREETPYRESVLADKEKALYACPVKKLLLEEQVTGDLKSQGIFLTSRGEKPLGKVMQDSYLAARTKQELLVEDKWHISEEQADGVYFLMDAGEETTGLLSLDFEVPSACDVLIGWGEHLEDLRVRSFVGQRNFCVSYHAKEGRNRFFHPFLRLGMRYLQVHIYNKEGILHHAGIRRTVYPLKIQTNEITEPLHRRIYDVGVKTLQLCMHEHYEDSPWREQALYAFDSRIQMLCGYYAFGEYEFPKASIELMARTLRDDGLLEIAPPGQAVITIPYFTAVFVRQVYEYLVHSGDLDFGKQLYQTVTKIVEKFADRIDSTGLIPSYTGVGYWNFYDWTKDDRLAGRVKFLENPPYECPLNAMISDAFSCYAQICRMLEQEGASHYNDLHENLNRAIHTHFYDEKRQAYMMRCGEPNEMLYALNSVLALYVGAVPETERSKVLEHLMKGDMIPCSLSSSIFEFEVFLQSGDAYRDYVKQKIETVWGRMLFAGSTTFWETEVGSSDFLDAGSLCHGWSAVPVYIYRKYNLCK